MTAAEEFVAAIEARVGKPGKRNGKNVRLICPAHDDHDPSLDVAEGEDGSPLVQCRSHGCSYEDVCRAIGHEPKDFLPERAEASSPELWTPRGPAIAVYRYVDENDRHLFDVCRTAGKEFPARRPDPSAKSGWRWNLSGVRRVLYRLPEVLGAIEGGETIYVCEGEKDVEAILGKGAVATCNPGGAGKWRPEYTEQLAGAERIVVVADNDEPGLEHAIKVRDALSGIARDVRIVHAAVGKDAADHLAAGLALTALVDAEAEADAAVATERFAIPMDEWIATEDEESVPLLGTEGDAIVPVGGLVFLAGNPGVGKTTLALDLVFHLASGLPWLEVATARPLRILIIENEGPPTQFKKKLRAKRETWKAEIPGDVHVHLLRWGAFSFAHGEDRLRLGDYLAAERIDLVVADPLGTLGTIGAGSPEDTLAFVRHLKEMGLGTSRTFLFLHHFRKETAAEELTALSGSWGPHLDTLLVLKATGRADEARLSFAKLRWAEPRPALILGLVRNTRAFELLGAEDSNALVERRIVELLADGKPRTAAEIADGKKGGIGVRRSLVATALEGNDHLFRSVNGKEVGRNARATCWLPTEAASPSATGDEPDPEPAVEEDWRELVPDEELARMDPRDEEEEA